MTPAMHAIRPRHAAFPAAFTVFLALAAMPPRPALAATIWTCAHNEYGREWTYPGPRRPFLRRYLLDGGTFVSLDGIEMVERLSGRDVAIDDDIVAFARWTVIEDTERKLVAVQYLDDEASRFASFSALIVDKGSGLMRLIETTDADRIPHAYFGSCSVSDG